MKDFLGNELAIGDVVIFPEPKYRNLRRGKIIAFTPKKVRIEYQVPWTKLKFMTTYLIEPEFNVIKDSK